MSGFQRLPAVRLLFYANSRPRESVRRDVLLDLSHLSNLKKKTEIYLKHSLRKLRGGMAGDLQALLFPHQGIAAQSGKNVQWNQTFHVLIVNPYSRSHLLFAAALPTVSISDRRGVTPS
jgi:hypothetical protein